MPIKLNKYISSILPASLLALALAACTDDDLTGKNSPNPDIPENIDLTHYVAVPIGISYQEENTRAGDDDDDYKDGTAREHRIDWSFEESFALFFDEEKKFMSVKQLHTYTSLGTGVKPDDGIGEYAVHALSYVHEDSVPTYVMVVLNGGRIKKKLFDNDKQTEEGQKLRDYLTRLAAQTDAEYNADGKKDPIAPCDVDWNYFLAFTWESEYSDDTVIGTNDEGLFTMTNSAYYGYDNEYVEALEAEQKNALDEAEAAGRVIDIDNIESSFTYTPPARANYTLQTIRRLNKNKIVKAMATNMVPKHAAATVYVERMVVKFSAPVFSTDIIGRERYFVPSQNALSMIFYSFDPEKDNALVAVNRNWRIHVLGWTINGREKSNYLYKHIIQAKEKELKDWGFDKWNREDKKRSFWSIDTHYDNKDKDGNIGQGNDFYPWQYRKSIDNPGISLEFGEGENPHEPALRYFDFQAIKDKGWRKTLTISENTYDPKVYEENSSDYDGRTPVLVGPHLIVIAQMLIEDPDLPPSELTYIGNFAEKEHVYSDRLRRFYDSEVDMFKMFIRDMNRNLATQPTMQFSYYNWDKKAGDDVYQGKFIVKPTGKCRLYIDTDLEVNHILYDYRGEELTMELVDKLTSEGGALYGKPLSIITPIKDGDGRVLPWIDGIVMRGEESKDRLPVWTASDYNELHDPAVDDNANAKLQAKKMSWTVDMRKSIVFDWFGPVDHYDQGYMYYWNPIPHYKPAGSTLTYYGTVRNHWYTFTVTAINSLGIPIDNIKQRIIPARYNYQGMISVDCKVLDYHHQDSDVWLN